MRRRRRNLLKHARDMGCDSLVAFEPENLFYMTGFWGEAIGLLEAGGRTTIIAPELEVGRAMQESEDCEVVTAERGTGLVSSLAKRVTGRACTDCQNYATVTALKKSIPRTRPSAEPFYAARLVKDEHELRVLRKASKIIDAMFELCHTSIKAGQKESELQAILMSYAASHDMFDTGYRSTTNPLIIAGGPNGALPHAQVTGRKFRRGDLIVVDLTLRYRGYVSDATRTFALGRIPDHIREAYEIVRESQRLGLAAVKPNARCSDVDAACRRHIEENDYGEFFIHSTGHGIGLDVHELPNISHKSDTKLKRNMAITVEPGIYVENNFGIRIEDSVIVGKRAQVMHKFTKELLTV